MPAWTTPECIQDVPRDIALLDTNVLIAMFDEGDVRHGDANAAVDMGEFQWGVCKASIIEAWNFLVGKVKRLDFAYNMMRWLLTPGNVTYIIDGRQTIETLHDYSVRHRIDIVDAALMDLADKLTRHCGIFPFVHVATYDAADFLRLFGRADLNFNVYDMRDLSSTTGSF